MATNGNPVQVVFFDARDTLGEVDRPGHLVPYRPSTEKLLSSMKEAGLTIGVITNLPEDVAADQGRSMVVDAVLNENGGERIVRIGDFIDADHVFINHELGLQKPDPAIFRKAAELMGVAPDQCLFVGENLIEVLSARAAGLQSELKPCPPGREFMPAPLTQKRATDTYSGRAFEDFFETEHLLGDRIFACGEEIVRRLKELPEGERIPQGTYAAMGILIYLTNNFADQAHLKAEEAAIPIAVARGLDPDSVDWVFRHHEQGRAYFRAMDIAWERIKAAENDPQDLPYAIDAFWRNTEGFVKLFIHHAERENDQLYPSMGRHFTDMDDTLVINMISHIGPADFTPYIGLVAAMEESLGVQVAA
jgi:beta-phosphoglucomutase-like phosphatase (HAD superfamily)/hemerythrin-like domain-containing protein